MAVLAWNGIRQPGLVANSKGFLISPLVRQGEGRSDGDGRAGKGDRELPPLLNPAVMHARVPLGCLKSPTRFVRPAFDFALRVYTLAVSGSSTWAPSSASRPSSSWSSAWPKASRAGSTPHPPPGSGGGPPAPHGVLCARSRRTHILADLRRYWTKRTRCPRSVGGPRVARTIGGPPRCNARDSASSAAENDLWRLALC